jgi:type IV pilus assembly protein PilW
MMASNRSSLPRRSQRGLTLVELMVGLTLGLVITSALLLLLANASANGQSLQRAGMQIENGRYVSELLREDLRLAGFYGETSIAGALYETPDPCSTTPTGWNGAPFTLPTPIQGYGPADVLSCIAADRKPGTYAIAVRRLSIDTIDPASLGVGNRQYYVQYSYCLDDVTTPRLVFDKDPVQLALRNRACSARNTARAYVTRIYYVASCNRCGIDTTPTLKRVELVGDALVTTALADGVDDLRLEYGFDTDGNGSADTYLSALGTGAAASWFNVMAVKVHLITRSLDKATGNLATAQEFNLGGIGTVTVAADGYTRRAYSASVRLINPSGAREVQ